MNDAHVVLQAVAEEFVPEGAGRVSLFDVVVFVLIHVFEIEGFRDRAVAGYQECVAFFQHLVLLATDGVLVGSVLHQFPQNGRAAAQIAVEQHIECAGGGGLLGFGHRILGHDAVLVHDVHEHIPLAAVVDAGAHDVGHGAVVGGQMGGVQNAFQIIVHPLEFIPEGQIALGQLKRVQIQLLRHDFPEHVGGGKKPAAAALLLAGGTHGLDVHGEFELHLPCGDGIKGQIVHIGLGEGVCHHAADGVGFVGRFVAGKVFLFDVGSVLAHGGVSSM